MEIKKVLIVYKTHLDIGFTDFAENVRQKYLDVFIPNAMQTARTLREEGGEAQFKWTTGSWLINEYLKYSSPEKADELRKAIRAGDICWHGLPCTTHTELMSAELFEYGLSLSQRLDAEFGTKTIAAKMTDVPGHTKAMIPLLKKAGIEMLHIGVNPASAVPDVPEIFRWQADSGEKITVIYSGEYGDLSPLGDTGTALYFAHTNDNLGGQSADEVKATFAHLHEILPGAELVAADLNDAAIVLREIEDTLPVLTGEIGDSWIHGVGSDPKKVSQFRGLCRLFKELDGDDKETLGEGLLLVPEHTWGLDVKSHLNDWKNYSPSDLAANRDKPNFRKMEASWQEQRQFMYSAVEKLSEENKIKARKILDEASRPEACTDGFDKIYAGENIKIGEYVFNFSLNGAINFLKKGNKVYADGNHLLCVPLYEQFCFENYVKFHKNYHRIEDPWAWEDFTKLGMNYMTDEKKKYFTGAEIFTDGKTIVVKYSFPNDAFMNFGAPKKMDIIISVSDSGLCFDFAWFGKRANRGAEALWFGFNPIASGRRIRKLGTSVDILKVESRGNRNLHASDYGVIFNELSIESIDTALVSPQKPCVLDYPNEIPTENEGIYFGLYNNIWATNFRMWYDEDSRFRFNMKFE